MFVDAVLHRWGRDGAIDRLALIASELVTNAVAHTRTDVWLAVEALDNVIRLEVGDGTDAEPPDLVDPRLIEALATSWGTEIANGASCLWAEVRG